jgi:hypothetical protein
MKGQGCECLGPFLVATTHMTSDKNIPDNEAPVEAGKRRRGRPSSGQSRGEASKVYESNYRDRLLREGRVEIKAFISTSTKADLQTIRQLLGLSPKCAAGEVIDAMVQHIKKNF